MSARRVPAWPVGVLALPAAVAIWSGWVGLGAMTGFGVVQLLPGIWDGARINTAITLPIGMEAYAAYALRAWLTPGTPQRARQFAKASAIGALILGALGQIGYHLMAAATSPRRRGRSPPWSPACPWPYWAWARRSHTYSGTSLNRWREMATLPRRTTPVVSGGAHPSERPSLRR